MVYDTTPHLLKRSLVDLTTPPVFHVNDETAYFQNSPINDTHFCEFLLFSKLGLFNGLLVHTPN